MFTTTYKIEVKLIILLIQLRSNTVKPLIKDTPKEDKPPNKGQAKSTLVFTLYRKSPLKEDNLSTKLKDKTAVPESVLSKRFHCTKLITVSSIKSNYIYCRQIAQF